MKLCREHITEIAKLVETQGIELPGLKDDLIDHMCCYVEARMEEGLTFQDSLQQAVLDVAPKGFREIQEEAAYLLMISKTRNMKKLTFFVGSACFLGMGVGCLLAVMKFAMGHMIFGLAAFAFIILFLPIDAIRHFRTSNEKLPEKIRYVFGTASTVVLATGVTAWIMQLPGANEIIVGGLIVFVAGYLPLQLFKMYRESFAS